MECEGLLRGVKAESRSESGPVRAEVGCGQDAVEVKLAAEGEG